MPPKAQSPPTSAFSEPSEPSDIVPENNPREQLTRPQEENPQVVLRIGQAQYTEPLRGETGRDGESGTRNGREKKASKL